MNKLRGILDANGISFATRVSSRWGLITDIVGSAKCYDYIEYLVECSPFTVEDFENASRACELSGMGSIVKVDFQNRALVAQKAIAAGIQGVLFADCKTVAEVEESIYVTTPDCPEFQGRFGYPAYRGIGYHPNNPQMDYAKMIKDTVRLFMIEKKEAVDNIEAICKVPGVDMIQFGPSDYSMSRGFDYRDHVQEVKDIEKYCISVALAHGVQPRCEIEKASDARYYMDLGVRHFCLGDQVKILRNYWHTEGAALKTIVQ